MKHVTQCLIIIALLAGLHVNAIAIPPQMSRVYQLAASGWVALTEAQADGLNINFRGQNTMPEVMLNWLKIESGHASSLGQVYPNDVYQLFLMGFDGFQYGDVSVSDAWKAPTNCAVNGSAIECDDDPNETESLYIWDYVSFTPSQVSGTVAGGKVTFSGLSSGVYVVSRKEQSFPSLFLTVP